MFSIIDSSAERSPSTSRIAEAGKLLFDNNPLSLVCCHVCPQENQCEGHCVMGKKGMPVQISAIEQYISDYYLSIYKPEPTPREERQGRVAIIGSGPAGFTIAFMLARKKYDITIRARGAYSRCSPIRSCYAG